jgi:hypothetical protein
MEKAQQEEGLFAQSVETSLHALDFAGLAVFYSLIHSPVRFTKSIGRQAYPSMIWSSPSILISLLFVMPFLEHSVTSKYNNNNHLYIFFTVPNDALNCSVSAHNFVTS